MEALQTLAARGTGLLVTIATPLAMLWVGWSVLKALLSGSTDRALTQLLVKGLIAGVLLAALNHLPDTFNALGLVGNALFMTVVQSIQGAF